MNELTKDNAKQQADAYAPIIDAVKGRTFDMLDDAAKQAKRLQRTLFGILRECRNHDTATAVLHSLERAWVKARTVDVDGIIIKPTLARSYSATKSAMLKAWAEGPHYQREKRKQLQRVCEQSGDDFGAVIARNMGDDPDQFLRLTSDRYAGERLGDTLFMRDLSAGKAAEASNKKHEKDEARGKQDSDKAATTEAARGFVTGNGGTFPDALPEQLGAALNKFILTVRNVWKDCGPAELASYINDMTKDVADWADKNRKTKAASVAALKEIDDAGTEPEQAAG